MRAAAGCRARKRLDGDGKSDIVWQNDDGRIAVWLMNGTTMTCGGDILGAGTGLERHPR